jgi:hypothetical protein
MLFTEIHKLQTTFTEVLGSSFFNTGLAVWKSTKTLSEVGEELGVYYGLTMMELFKRKSKQTAWSQSILKFKDLDGNGAIDDNDKTFLGSPIPNLTYGFGFSFSSYSNVDFAAALKVQGNEL